MDLSAIMQNLHLTRSRSPSPDREVTLQMLRHHTKPSYQQIETYPGEDILKRNFQDLLDESQRMSETPNRQLFPSSSRRPLYPQAEREQATQQQHQQQTQRSVAHDQTAHVVPTAPRTSTDNFWEEERREQVIREEGLKDRELNHLSRVRDVEQRPSSTGSEQVFVPAPTLHTQRLASVKHEIISQLCFFGVDLHRATTATARLQGRNRDADYATLLEVIPTFGPLQCSVSYLEQCMRHILNGGSATQHRSDTQQAQRGPDHFDYTAYYSSPSLYTSNTSATSQQLSEGQQPQHLPPPLVSASPSSVSTLTPMARTTTATESTSPSRAETLPSLFGRTTPQHFPSEPQAPFPPIMSNNQSLPPSPFSPILRSGEQSLDHSNMIESLFSLPAPPVPQPPQPTKTATPHWGSREWELSQNKGPISDVASSAPPAPLVPIHPLISYPDLPAPTTLSPVASLHSPTTSIAAPNASPAPIPATTLASAPDSLSSSIPSVTTPEPHAPPPLTPARTSVPQHVKEETLTTHGMSRSPSASPSTSFFRSGPQREPITIRGNSAIEAHFFTAISPGPVTEPPRLKANHSPELGDLLFNKFPTSSANLKNAQVWMWTDPEGTGNPDWEDIEECYGSMANPINHPRDSTRFLMKGKKDGKPGWVTENTLKQHIAQAAKQGDN